MTKNMDISKRQDLLVKTLKRLIINPTPQISGLLKSPKGYCCLGDICSVVAKETNYTLLEREDNFLHFTETGLISGSANTSVLPCLVQKLYGLTDVGEFVGFRNQDASLSFLNDVHAVDKKILGLVLLAIVDVEIVPDNFKSIRKGVESYIYSRSTVPEDLTLDNELIKDWLAQIMPLLK